MLEQAGISSAPAVILTTHDDDTNVYMAIFVRRLRGDIQIIARANLERNISTLHRAGADFVMSYAGMGSNAILNLLRRGSLLMIAEGLDLMRVSVPKPLVGRSIAESGVRNATGCSVVGVRKSEGMVINPPPATVMKAGDEIVLIGTVEAGEKFLENFPSAVDAAS